MSQSNNIKYTVISCLAIISMVIGLFVYDTVTEKELTADQYKLLKFYKLNTERQLSDFSLATGPNKFTNENLEGKWSLIFMGFASCPDMCPMTMKQMAKTSEFLELEMPDAKEKISFTIVSVDPDRDTPEAILQYAQAFNPNFVGVSGAIDQIYTLATNLTLPFVPVLNSESTDYDMDHSMNLALISPDGKYFGFFKSPHNPENIAKALKSLITFAK